MREYLVSLFIAFGFLVPDERMALFLGLAVLVAISPTREGVRQAQFRVNERKQRRLL